MIKTSEQKAVEIYLEYLFNNRKLEELREKIKECNGKDFEDELYKLENLSRFIYYFSKNNIFKEKMIDQFFTLSDDKNASKIRIYKVLKEYRKHYLHPVNKYNFNKLNMPEKYYIDFNTNIHSLLLEEYKNLKESLDE